MTRCRPTVTVSDVCVRYGDRVALSGATASFAFGSVTALIGPNGAGKSTLLNVLAGVVHADAGTVHTTRRPAYVLQRSNLPESMPLSVREAVAMGTWADRGIWRPLGPTGRRLVAECLQQLDIVELARRQVGELSGGQRQRVLVAQALAQRSDLLLLDEPFGGVDTAARHRIVEAISAEAARGACVIFSTHDLEDATSADQVVLLVDGRQRVAGPPSEVLEPTHLADAYVQVERPR